jgi:hypothetical protein
MKMGFELLRVGVAVVDGRRSLSRQMLGRQMLSRADVESCRHCNGEKGDSHDENFFIAEAPPLPSE